VFQVNWPLGDRAVNGTVDPAVATKVSASPSASEPVTVNDTTAPAGTLCAAGGAAATGGLLTRTTTESSPVFDWLSVTRSRKVSAPLEGAVKVVVTAFGVASVTIGVPAVCDHS